MKDIMVTYKMYKPIKQCNRSKVDYADSSKVIIIQKTNHSNSLFSSWAFKYIIFSQMPQLFFPTAVLLARHFYKKQRDIIALKEKQTKQN